MRTLRGFPFKEGALDPPWHDGDASSIPDISSSETSNEPEAATPESSYHEPFGQDDPGNSRTIDPQQLRLVNEELCGRPCNEGNAHSEA